MRGGRGEGAKVRRRSRSEGPCVMAGLQMQAEIWYFCDVICGQGQMEDRPVSELIGQVASG